MGEVLVEPAVLAAAEAGVARAAEAAGAVAPRVRAVAPASGAPLVEDAARVFAEEAAGRLALAAQGLHDVARALSAARAAYGTAERTATGVPR
ncbi:hypothetical protein [Vallicoccus soli]|uniref:Uncharacterized protein n=1 Tax=Vallicoccus soli TaxID=2339232 RepID=A0A3A3Z0L4_9ACTN|nr:hypothetical protein [Vallicoccus soli]RJK97789.1 hypothetical protein D5H78_02015 [Vallicoccus soli]